MEQKIFSGAEWIFADCGKEKVCDSYFEYRTSFDADPGVTTKLYIGAYSQYVVYINGQFVDCGQYDDYENYQVYDTLDITGYLKARDNELYIGHYVCGSDFSTRRVQIPGIIFDIRSGEKNLLSSSCSCLARENRHFLENGEIITPQLGYNFEYDACAAEAEYVPCVLAGKEKNLYPRPIKKLEIGAFRDAQPVAQGLFLENDASLPKSHRMQTAYLSACKWEDGFHKEENGISWKVPEEKRCDGVYLVLNVGGESTGLLEFTLDVPEDTEVLIGFGEHLDDMRVRTAISIRNFTFRYLAKKGHNQFFYPYQRMGLKYLQFHIYSKEGTISAGIRPQMYPLTQYTLPITDKLHQKIYDVGCNTLKLCMHEHYEDCPWREQSQYAMDSRIQILCGYYAFKEFAFPRATLLLMLRSLRPDGLLTLCAPGNAGVDIPSFSAVFVREVLEYVEYSKDTAFIEEVFPDLKKLVEGFAGRVLDNHLIPQFVGEGYWNFYEWRTGIDGETKPTGVVYDCLLNAFVSDAFRCFAKICEIAGKAELAELYYGYHKDMNKANHEMFFDENAGAYRSNMTDDKPLHMLTQGMMLFVDAVPKGWIDAVAHSITDGDLIPCSISMSIYVYEALLKNPEKYSGYVISQIETVWDKMLSAGADTFWETELGADDFDKAGSLCHGWSAVPVYLFGKYFYKQ